MTKEKAAPAESQDQPDPNGNPPTISGAPTPNAESQGGPEQNPDALNQAGPVEGIQVKRAKLGRGNMRRITKARDELDKALLDFEKAMDPLVFQCDDAGNRIGRWPLLDSVKSARELILADIAAVMAQQ